jgi:hypothetical protein
MQNARNPRRFQLATLALFLVAFAACQTAHPVPNMYGIDCPRLPAVDLRSTYDEVDTPDERYAIPDSLNQVYPGCALVINGDGSGSFRFD